MLSWHGCTGAKGPKVEVEVGIQLGLGLGLGLALRLRLCDLSAPGEGGGQGKDGARRGRGRVAKGGTHAVNHRLAGWLAGWQAGGALETASLAYCLGQWSPRAARFGPASRGYCLRSCLLHSCFQLPSPYSTPPQITCPRFRHLRAARAAEKTHMLAEPKWVGHLRRKLLIRLCSVSLT